MEGSWLVTAAAWIPRTRVGCRDCCRAKLQIFVFQFLLGHVAHANLVLPPGALEGDLQERRDNSGVPPIKTGKPATVRFRCEHMHLNLPA